MIILAWLSSIIISFPSISYTTYKLEYNIDTNLTITICYMDRHSLFYKAYFTSFYFTFIFIPAFIIIFIYVIIIRKLKTLNKFVYNSDASVTKKFRRNGESSRKFTRDEDIPENSYSLKNLQETLVRENDSNKEKLHYSRCESKSSNSIKSNNNNNSHEANFSTQNSINARQSEGSMYGSIRLKGSNSIMRPNFNSKKSIITKRKLTITLCLISIAFFFCQLPIRGFQIFNIFYEFESLGVEEHDYIKFKIINIIFLFTKLLYFLHGMSNPIIYNLMSTKFRKSFKKVIFCRIAFNHILKRNTQPKLESPLFD